MVGFCFRDLDLFVGKLGGLCCIVFSFSSRWLSLERLLFREEFIIVGEGLVDFCLLGKFGDVKGR